MSLKDFPGVVERPEAILITAAKPRKQKMNKQIARYSASEVTTIWRYTNVYIIIIIIIINKKITLQPAVAAVQPCQVQQQQAVSLTTEPCVLSVAEYQLLLLACTSPGTVPALYPVTSPVNQNHNFICKFNTWTLAITFMSIISL